MLIDNFIDKLKSLNILNIKLGYDKKYLCTLKDDNAYNVRFIKYDEKSLILEIDLCKCVCYFKIIDVKLEENKIKVKLDKSIDEVIYNLNCGDWYDFDNLPSTNTEYSFILEEITLIRNNIDLF